MLQTQDKRQSRRELAVPCFKANFGTIGYSPFILSGCNEPQSDLVRTDIRRNYAESHYWYHHARPGVHS